MLFVTIYSIRILQNLQYIGLISFIIMLEILLNIMQDIYNSKLSNIIKDIKKTI